MLVNEQNFDQLIETIRKVHRTTIDQRFVDLTEFLDELFRSIRSEQIFLFRGLTKLLENYEDRAALKTEFLKAKCLETIVSLFDEEEQNLTTLMEFLTELLNKSEIVQEKFQQTESYEKLFGFLRFIRFPSMDLINRFLYLMIDKTFSSPVDSSSLNIEPDVQLINPDLALVLIRWVPHLAELNLQSYVLSTIERVFLSSMRNKSVASSSAASLVLIEILAHRENFHHETLLNVLRLVESLARFSIDRSTIRRIFQLFNDENPLKKHLLRILIVSALFPDPDRQFISSYFDFHHPDAVRSIFSADRRKVTTFFFQKILVSPVTRPNFVPTQSLTIHVWLRFNENCFSSSRNGHRQICAIYCSAVGFELFVFHSSLVVTIIEKNELFYSEIKDFEEILDARWHCLTLVQTTETGSRLSAAFQVDLCSNLKIYVDGLLRKEISDWKSLNLSVDPIQWVSIGGENNGSKFLTNKTKNSTISESFVRRIRPLTGLFSSKSRNSSSAKEKEKVPSESLISSSSNDKQMIFGSSTSLFGQICSFWLLNESLEEKFVQKLFAAGKFSLSAFRFVENLGNSVQVPIFVNFLDFRRTNNSAKISRRKFVNFCRVELC